MLLIFSGKQQQATAGGAPGGTTFDLEPIYTYRGHTSRVLSLALAGNTIYSGAESGRILQWAIPANFANTDPLYNAFDPGLLLGRLDGHTDAVWSLATLTPPTSATPLLCSASADGSVRVWDTQRLQSVKTITLSGERR